MATSAQAPRLGARHSLRVWLPCSICALIVAPLAISLWLADRLVETTLIRTAGNRAQRAADQIADLLDRERSLEQLRDISNDAALKQFLRTRTDDARRQALARLRQFSGTSMRRIQLWDEQGALVLEVTSADASDNTAPDSERLPRGDKPSTEGIGPLQAAGDVVFSDTVAAIHDDRAPPAGPSPLGYFRVRVTFVETPPGIFSRLVGEDAVIRIGNREGGLWTDLTTVAPLEQVDLARRGVQTFRAAAGDTRLGAVSLVSATPWAVWVGFPAAAIVAPADQFSRDMLAIAAPFVVAAALFAVWLAFSITRPLARLNAAAAAVAVGNYSPRVSTGRRDELGQLARAFDAMAADVQAKAEALLRSEAGYRELFAANPLPMWVYDVETLRFIGVNDMAVRLYGYSRDEFLAMTISDIRPSEEARALRDRLALTGPADQSGVWKHRKKDGTSIDVELSSHTLLLDGRPARVVLANDVTARIASQRALVESEARFRDMAENMPHIVWTARPDGRRDYFNHHWYDYTGATIDATLGEGWRSAMHPDDLEGLIERWEHALGAGDEQAARYRLRRRDGSYRWHAGRASPLRNDDGRIAMWVGTMTDIEDALRAEEELRRLNEDLEHRVQTRTAQLESVNRELEAFSSSVSHDLRAPLRHVQGYVEMLTESAGDQLSGDSRRYLKTIRDATVEMGDLIDGLLSFSRIGRVAMAQSRVPLDPIVRSTIKALELETRDRSIDWRIEPLPFVDGDAAMLRQVYANLIANAVKYTGRRDHAIIEIGCAGEEDGHAVLFVRDNGAGFDMRYADKLFGVFQRLHGSDEFEGTGIGLATVRRIVTRHGGRVWAEGRPGAGATFFFTLQSSPVES
jgi:PAS domain S-box-containing protein